MDADRTSPFLVDSLNQELYAQVINVGHTSFHNQDLNYVDRHWAPMFSFIRKIRFPMDKSVAGYVVSTS